MHRHTSNMARESASTSNGMEHVMTQVMPSGRRAKKIESEIALAAARYAMPELLFVRRKDLDASSAPRNRDIPLLRIRRRADCRIGEEHVIDSLALRAVRRDGIPADELPVTRRKDAPVG
jgi:hypothetical protein